jgi:DNA-binding IscR family transcriptional regulator
MSGAVSLGLRALLLIRLDRREGEWVDVDTLANVHRLEAGRVRDGLQQLWDEGYVSCRLGADGRIEAARSMVGA